MKPKSFADWAAAGGHIPKGINSKEWDKTVKKYAGGGLLKKAIKSLAPEAPPVNRLDMSFKDVTKRVPELTEAAQKVSRGEMTSREYSDLVKKVKPVTPYSFVPKPASADEATNALIKGKKEKYGMTRDIPAGEVVDTRLDIPAYKDYGVWVNSVHRAGEPTVYGPVSVLRNVTMTAPPEKALGVATGETAKAPFAKIRGEWVPTEEAEAIKKAQKYLKSKDWRQVGYDPERSSQFYDRETMQPILAGEEALQIGPLVLVKKPQYGDINDFPFKDGGEVNAAGGGLLKAIKAAKGAQQVLPQAEREANLAKLLEPSKIKERLYHGTRATENYRGEEAIRKFKPSKEGALGSGTYLTPQSKLASSYAEQEGGNVLPVYAQIKNPLILRGSGVPDKYKDPMVEALEALGMESDKAHKMVERAYETKGYIGKEVESRARAAGYDGLLEYDRNGNLVEVVSYNPNAIKSATGNVGTYDVTKPDLSKAEGGDVSKAAFGVFPQMKRKRTKQDPEAAKRVPLDLARGFVAGTLGLPGDLESLARILMNIQGPDRFVMPTSKDEAMAMLGQIFGADRVSMDTKLPTSEEIEAKLPLRGDSPASSLATGVGQLGGGFYTGPASGARAMTAIPKAVVKAGKDFVQSAGQGVSPLTVYHGSPHKFDKFDASKIGTGEGAQAYGHGLYFAESPGVAKTYQPRSPKFEEKLIGLYQRASSSRNFPMMEVLEDAMLHRTPTEIIQKFTNAEDGYTKQHAKAAQDFAKWYSKNEPEVGGLYTVDLPDEKIARMLDWDKPLSEQPEVIKALKGTDYEVGMSQKQAEKVADQRLRQEADEWAEMTGGDPVDFINNADWEKYVDQVRKESGSVDSSITGEKFHSMIMRDEGYRPELFDPENYQIGTSEALRGYGIPGVKYLDATSRQAGEGTRNFVVFPGEEDALTILERKKEGGEVKMAEGGAAFGVFPQMKPRRSKQDPEAAKTFPIDVARGFVSGALGMPGDIESLVRMLPGFDEKTILPTSEDIEKRLPLRSDTPAARAATGLGQIGGGFYTGPLSGARAAVAVPKAVMQAGRDFVQAAGQPAVNVIKPKGGNWLEGSVERALKGLKTNERAAENLEEMRRVYPPEVMARMSEETRAQVERGIPHLEKQVAINNWIDRNLANYVKKEMATPEDPVRKLAEQGITHMPKDALGRGSWLSENMERIRRSEGFPGEGMARTEAGQGWENLADESIQITAPIVANKEMLAANPWLSKLDPNQSVYRAREADFSELNLDHIVDVLKQDLAAGRIRPEQLNKVSMEQAVRRTAEFDQEMAKKMREAQIKATEGMPVVKEYPEGYKWVELTAKYPEQIPEGFGNVQNFPKAIKAEKIDAPGTFIHGSDMNDLIRGIYKQFPETKGNPEKALETALKYEGETMGHCVGGYCPDVLEGRSRIYSLRDAKGEPHVTVEVQPNTYAPRWEDAKQYLAAAEEEAKRLPNGYTDLDVSEIAVRMAKENAPPIIKQIKGKQNAAPKEEYLPFVQDFVRSGQWSEVGDFKNTGLIRKSDLIDKFGPDELDAIGKGEYLTKGEYDDLLLKALKPEEGMKRGGEVKMQAGGIAKTLKKLVGPSAEAAAKEASAAERAAAGRMAADVTKATQPMKMSEALGNLNVEGKGKVKITQSDRTKVGGGNIGGAMFPGLSQVDPLYEGLVWGVGKKPTASSLINQSDDLTYWTTILGAEDQLKTNPIVFNKLRQGFVDAMKQGKLDKELEGKINRNLSLTFGEGADIRDPKIWRRADTFEKRAALADIMLGQGIPPGKGGVALGGEKSGKGVIFKPTDILKRETEPLLLHPEHGGDVPTFAVGPRLFQFSGGMKVRPDLHPGFPVLLEGQDLGMVFRPAPGEVAMRDFTQRMASERGRKPGYYEWTMGEKGKGLPSQDITEEYLTYLQKAGYAKGGKVGALSKVEKRT